MSQAQHKHWPICLSGLVIFSHFTDENIEEKRSMVFTPGTPYWLDVTRPGQLESPGSPLLLSVCGWVCAETFCSYLPLLPINSSRAESPSLSKGQA